MADTNWGRGPKKSEIRLIETFSLKLFTLSDGTHESILVLSFCSTEHSTVNKFQNFTNVNLKSEIIEFFKDSFVKNRILEFSFWTLILSISTYPSNDNKLHRQNMISSKIVMTNIREKLRNVSLMFLSKNHMMKNVSEKQSSK